VRIAVVAALLVHAVLIAWLAPRERAPAPEPPAQASTPTDTLVNVVLLDEPTPGPVTAGAKLPVTRASAADNSRHASSFANAVPAPAANDATPPAAPPAHDYFAMRHVDLSPAQIVDRASAREGAPPRAASDGELRPSGHGTYITDLGGSDWRDRTATAHVARDGTVRFDNAPDFDIHFAGLGVAGKFNVDDWLTRKAGIDPYASAKLAYLDRTRDERARIAEVNRADDLAHAQRALRRNLDAVRAIADSAARKRALFELWDDAAETGDDALVRAGADARAYLVGAIRAMRPALVFTPDELARLNAHRHSRAVFAPYE
jgi:hypothetical protein